MRRSDLAIVFIVASTFIPATALAQRSLPDTNQSSSQIGPSGNPQQSGRSEAQNTPTQPERTPQQSDQARERERRSAEDTRINRDWTARERGGDTMDMDRMPRRQMGRMMDQDEEHRTTGRSWRRDEDDMDRGRAYGSWDRSEGRYYREARPHSRVKSCIEYENGDEFCRYRD
jgi:hypothetical protein